MVSEVRVFGGDLSNLFSFPTGISIILLDYIFNSFFNLGGS